MNKYKIYDNITYKLTVNIFTLNKERKTIDIYGFKPEEKAHQLFLQAATIIGNLTGKKIRLNSNFSTRLNAWRKYRKILRWIRRAPSNPKERTIDDVFAFMLESCKEETGNPDFKYEDIVEYYNSKDEVV